MQPTRVVCLTEYSSRFFSINFVWQLGISSNIVNLFAVSAKKNCVKKCVLLETMNQISVRSWIYLFICNSSGDNAHPIFFLLLIRFIRNFRKLIPQFDLSTKQIHPDHCINRLWCTVRFVEKINKPNNIHFPHIKEISLTLFCNIKETIISFLFGVNNKCLSLLHL